MSKEPNQDPKSESDEDSHSVDATAATIIADETVLSEETPVEKSVEAGDQDLETGEGMEADLSLQATVVAGQERPKTEPPPVRDDVGSGGQGVEADAATRVVDSGGSAKARPGAAVTVDVDAPTRVADARPTPSPADPEERSSGIQPGEVLFGEYEIVEVLGAGGMGEVYRARHRRLDETRAIKMMHADLSRKKGANQFFLREAKALLAVRHPAVVHCHDLLSDDQGRIFLIMEMIEGISLSELMEEGPLSVEDVITLGARVAAGLSAAHRCGVVHRDVSPDNIVLPGGKVSEAKLIDFGIAKILQEGEGTIVDGFKGKLSYASPEQLGFFGGKIDGRSDFYSLGLVLVAAALGEPMGMGTTVVEAVDARRATVRVPDRIPPGLRAAIEPLLALDPADRPQMVERLFVAPGVTPGEGDARFDSVGRPIKPKASFPLIPVVGGVAGLAMLGAAAIFFVSGSGPAPEPVAPERAAQTTSPEPQPAPSPLPAKERAAREQPAAPAPRTASKPGISALDKVRIVGLLQGAATALAENRLQSPKGDNAHEKYVAVLKLDPNNAAAKQGLVNVAKRYADLGDQALASGRTEEARDFLSRGISIAPTLGELASLRERLEQAESKPAGS